MSDLLYRTIFIIKLDAISNMNFGLCNKSEMGCRPQTAATRPVSMYEIDSERDDNANRIRGALRSQTAVLVMSRTSGRSHVNTPKNGDF